MPYDYTLGCRFPIIVPANHCSHEANGPIGTNASCAVDLLCYYGNAGGVSDWPPQTNCSINVFDTKRCGALHPVPASAPLFRPYVCLHKENGTMFAGQDAQPWFPTNDFYAFKEFLVDAGVSASIEISIQSCAPEDYCPGGGGQNWVSRWFTFDHTGYQFNCNEVEQCPDGNCDQYVRKPVFMELGRIGVGFFRVYTSIAPDCGMGLMDAYCFIAFCGAVPDKARSCVGDVDDDQARIYDRIYMTTDARFSDRNAPGEEYPQRNPYKTELLNAMFATFNDLVEQIDAPGHNPLQDYTASSLNLWTHSETLDAPVKGHASYYPAYEGIAIPISVRSLVGSPVLPAELWFKNVIVTLRMSGETRSAYPDAGSEMRVTAHIEFTIGLRVKLLAGAYTADPDTGKYDFLNPDDPYDLRIEEPAAPGIEYIGTRMIAMGPNREDVPMQLLTDPEQAHYVHWEGLLASRNISQGPHTWNNDTIGGGNSCCALINWINYYVFIYGRTDDNTGYNPDTQIFTPKEQRYMGGVSFAFDVALLGATDC